MSKQLNSHDFESMYKEMQVDIDSLGCIMLDVDGSTIKRPASLKDSDLYITQNPERKWIKGLVAKDTPHVTLLFGLMENGNTWKRYVDRVLKDWRMDSITVKKVSFFSTPYSDDPYYCIVAHLDITPELMEAHSRLQLLPHIDTFVGEYKAHITLAYIKKDEKLRDTIVAEYNAMLAGKKLKAKQLNYGYPPKAKKDKLRDEVIA